MKLKLMSMAAMALSALLCLTPTGAWADELTVYDGTTKNDFVPVYGYYCDAYLKCEAVMPASELSAMNGSEISAMTFYASNTSVSWGDTIFQVFLKEVSEATIGGFSGPGTVVYEGALSIVDGKMTVTFTTPYTYNGGNLLIGIYITVLANKFSPCSWYGESVSGASVQGHNYSDPTSVSPTQRNFLPKTTFTYETPATYSVSLKEGTEDASNWQGKADEGEYQALPLEGVAAGTAVSVKYIGTKKVKSVKAVKVKPAATVTTAPTAKTGVKAGQNEAIVNAGTATGGTMMYMVNATQPASTNDFSATVPTAEGLTEACTRYVWYYVKADDSHTDSEISATGIEVTIAAPAATVTTAPTAKTGVRAGQNEAIVNAGTAEGGTMMYMVNATQPASTEGFSDTVPTAEGLTAGTSYVWYYVKADASHTDSEISATAIAVAIGKADASVTAPTAVAASLTYSGSAQTLFSAGSTTGGTMKYKVTTTNSKPESTDGFTTTIDQGTNAGTYYLWYYVDGGDNYNTTDVNGTAVTKAIGKATASGTAPTAVAASLTYSGSAQTLFSAGSTTGGTMKYKVTTTNSKPASTADFTTTIDQGTNAGTYYLWYYVEGDANYNTTDVNGTAVTKAIGKAAATLTCNNSAISFSSSEATNSTKTKTGVSCTGGTINVTSANTGNCTVSYSSGTITVTRKNNSAFSNTQITVSVTPDDNHTAPSNVRFNVSAAQYYKPASSATSSDKGKLIGRDGKIYDNVAAATAAGTTAVAKIIYIGTTGHATYSHGLALALTDETGTMAWQAAKDACSAKNTSTPVTGATWLLASYDQWNYMKGASGAGSYTALRDGFSGISGASNLQSDYYWSSSYNSSTVAWFYGFGNDSWNTGKTDYDGIRVRACLAF